MRYNMFAQKGGASYGSLVCTVCNKNISFEFEHLANLSDYGDGARVLNMLGSPKPPATERRKPDDDAALSDNTL
jgi:hypothetical protein